MATTVVKRAELTRELNPTEFDNNLEAVKENQTRSLKNEAAVAAITTGAGTPFDDLVAAMVSPLADGLYFFTTVSDKGQYIYDSTTAEGYVIVQLWVEQAAVGETLEGSSKNFDGGKIFDRVKAEITDGFENDLDDIREGNDIDVGEWKVNLGITNVDNTSDLNKPISTATQASIDLKVDTTTFENDLDDIKEGNGIDVGEWKVNLGITNVDNTSDLNKPISTATQASIDLKVDTTTFENDLDDIKEGNGIDVVEWKINLGITNVDNTSDLDKPISTATQAAIDAIEVGEVVDLETIIAGLDSFPHAKRVKTDGGTCVDIVPLDEIVRKFRGGNYPSILTAPNSIKEGVVYSVIPTDSNVDLDFSRNGGATIINKERVIETVAANIPRRVFNDDGSYSILIETQSTNLYLNSDVLTTQNVTTTASTYTVSFYGKGTINFTGTYTGSLVGTGEFDRVSLTFTATAGALVSTVSGTVEKAQCENSSLLTSYIPTTGTSATRLDEVLTKTGISSYINSVEGSFYFDVKVMASSTIQIYNSVSARIWVEFTESDTKLFISNGGGAATLITNSETVSFNEFRKVIFTYSEDSFSLCVNGVDSTFTGTQSTFAANTLSTIRFDFGTKFVGRLKEFSHFKKVIQPSQRIKLTTL